MIRSHRYDCFFKRIILYTAFSFHCTLISFFATAQIDTNAIKHIYDRVLEFDESQLDSIAYYANLIEKESARIGFYKGELLSSRLKGIHAEFSGDYHSATNYYLRCLEISREKKLEAYESSALSDLAYLYMNLKNPAKAKEYYLETAKMALKRGEVSSIVIDLSNLGGIYNKLHQPDSAIYYLEEAMRVSKGFSDAEVDRTTMRNNMGNAFFQKKQWKKALEYFRINYQVNLKAGDKDMLWYDVLNMADVFIELQRFDSAKLFLDESYRIACELHSDRKEADVHQVLAKYFFRVNNYKVAYEELEKWNMIDTMLVNSETRNTILEMEEKFHARQRAQENRLLTTELEAGKLRARNMMIAFAGVGLLAVVTAVFSYLIRTKNKKLEANNKLIQEQNSRLAELNSEKNSLISVVSHDLNTPFSSIKMWVQLMESEKNGKSDNQVKAMDRIKSSVENGLTLIRNILDVERAETNSQVIRLEKTNIPELVEEVISDYKPAAENKEIAIHFDHPNRIPELLTDKILLSRVCSNLLSNALKFTHRGKRIFVSLKKETDGLQIIFRDEGQGIPPSELKNLFSKYSKVSTSSTEGETSTGLGLSIVKRILTELNGTISCISEPGVGSTFTVTLPA
ncbi:tetratricopeptide repeat-containing sensor histidine kinase [Pollutibacter soli]|uniref:tetratricopeptide repeat-containing sensor histidine kinase n=1 Tax=Pollutibacter soli TaxID=3034157 RepID=UPI003013A238